MGCQGDMYLMLVDSRFNRTIEYIPDIDLCINLFVNIKFFFSSVDNYLAFINSLSFYNN